MEKKILNLVGKLQTVLLPWEDAFPIEDEEWYYLPDELEELLPKFLNYAKADFANGVTPPIIQELAFWLSRIVINAPHEEDSQFAEFWSDLYWESFIWMQWLREYYPNIKISNETSAGAEETSEKWGLPGELDTERARKYFGIAIEKGWILPTSTDRFKWLMGGERGGKARLGYFVVKVFCPTNTETLPEQAINDLFGVRRIGSAITQVFNPKKPQRWRWEIDSIFED